MTARHWQENGDATCKQNQACASECIIADLSGMVAQERLSEEPKTNVSTTSEDTRIEEWTEDVSSISSKGSQNEDSSDSETGLEIISPDDCVGNFGNIVVKHSSDVQFGNKTYYQGPVTIKQFVYSGTDDKPLCIENGKDNFTFKPECVVIQNTRECEIKSDNNLDIDNVEKNKNVNNSSSSINKGVHWLNYAFNKRRIYIICTTLLLLIITLSLTTVLLIKKYEYNSHLPGSPEDSDEQENNTPIDPPIDPDVNITLPNKLKIVPRLEWVAQPPAEQPDALKTPVPYVIILHTATENCSDQATCVYHVRYIQTFHMESKGWWDIGYNFLVGGDGFAYEGRGWKQEGAHTYGYNARSIGIAFIGTFNKLLPPNRQIKAAKQLIELGVKKGYIAPNYKLLAHRQLSTTQSPGEALYENIKTWPHWSLAP